MTCNSPIEQQYYSTVLVNFEPVCYYCGLGGDEALVQDEVTELKVLCFCSTNFFFVLLKAKDLIIRCLYTNVAKKRRVNIAG